MPEQPAKRVPDWLTMIIVVGLAIIGGVIWNAP